MRLFVLQLMVIICGIGALVLKPCIVDCRWFTIDFPLNWFIVALLFGLFSIITLTERGK